MKRQKAYRMFFILAGLLALAALSCSGVSGISNLFATDTPTPTNTFTPSPTVTPSPTPTPTQTPTLTPTPPPTGSNMEEQADGSKLFTDYDNQFQVTLPEGWVILPLSSKDLADIVESAAEENPELKDTAALLKDLDPEVIRVMAFNKNHKYNINGFTTNMIVMAINDKVMTTMPMDFVMGMLEESVKQQGGVLLSTDNNVTTNANDVEIGSFEFKRTMPTALGTNVPVRIKAIVFRSADRLIMIQLSAPQQFGEELSPVMDQIKDSVKLAEE
jgi:hypothetical protein